MKRTLSVIVALVMLLTLTPAFAAQEEINIFMWSDYISDDLIANFEDEYGVRVNLSYMSDNADSITKLTAGAGSEYDLIMTCDAYMESLIAGGYLEQLDLSQIPNSENINRAYWSEQNQGYCVPYLMNYIYVVYDTERCPIEITCYNDLIRPEMKGQIGSVDGARNLFPIALIALGYDPNSRDENEIKEAYEWLVKYNENVEAYASTETNMVSGTISCMFTYDGNTAEAMAQLGENNTLTVAPSPPIPCSWASTSTLSPRARSILTSPISSSTTSAIPRSWPRTWWTIPIPARTTRLWRRLPRNTATAPPLTLTTRPTSSSRKTWATPSRSTTSIIRC